MFFSTIRTKRLSIMCAPYSFAVLLLFFVIALFGCPRQSALPTEPGPGPWQLVWSDEFDPDVVHGSAHTRAYYYSIGTQKTGKIEVRTSRTGFNVYAVEWPPQEIRWYVNDEHYFTFRNERLTRRTADYKQWPFDKPFHLILNIAVGGMWGGAKGIDHSIWPQRVEVDYVRIYQAQ